VVSDGPGGVVAASSLKLQLIDTHISILTVHQSFSDWVSVPHFVKQMHLHYFNLYSESCIDHYHSRNSEAIPDVHAWDMAFWFVPQKRRRFCTSRQ
jgi:hypothetical protein